MSWNPIWSRSHNKISHAVYVAPSFCFYSSARKDRNWNCMKKKAASGIKLHNIFLSLSRVWPTRLAVHYLFGFCVFWPWNALFMCDCTGSNPRTSESWKIELKNPGGKLRCGALRFAINLKWFMITSQIGRYLHASDHNKRLITLAITAQCWTANNCIATARTVCGFSRKLENGQNGFVTLSLSLTSISPLYVR